jgi:AbiV family abortive infection protein
MVEMKFLADEFEEGVRLSYEHAVQLIENAEILMERSRYSSARFLALHAREELGRAFFLLDDIERSSPGVSYTRWSNKLASHGPKMRRYHMAVNEFTGYRETPVTITWGEPESLTEFELDGEVIKRFASWDMESRDRVLYVDYRAVRGLRQWASPINTTLYDAQMDVGHSKLGCVVLEDRAKKLGVTLKSAE